MNRWISNHTDNLLFGFQNIISTFFCVAVILDLFFCAVIAWFEVVTSAGREEAASGRELPPNFPGPFGITARHQESKANERQQEFTTIRVGYIANQEWGGTLNMSLWLTAAPTFLSAASLGH